MIEPLPRSKDKYHEENDADRPQAKTRPATYERAVEMSSKRGFPRSAAGVGASGRLVHAEHGAPAYAPAGNDVLLVQVAPAPLAAAAGLAAPALAVLALRAVARVSAPLSPTLASSAACERSGLAFSLVSC